MSQTLSKADAGKLIREHRFDDLFIELGWDKDNLPPTALLLDDDSNLRAQLVAQKQGFVVATCNVTDWPARTERKKMLRKLSRSYYEHLLILCGENRQCWMVSIRPQNRPVRHVEVEWQENQNVQRLMEKLNGIVFDISEESNLGITDVVDRMRHAFMQNAEDVSRRFYGKFQTELKTFFGFIEGIQDQVSKKWYTALMLNRLMFIYFIQKRGFLDEDPNYLENRLQQTRSRYGPDEFHNRFYRHFLRRLFTEGLGTPIEERDKDLSELLGKVPYLNGGLFDIHEVEKQNKGIAIPDQAFEKLFDFFNQYQWSLDTRPTASGMEINPDVLGYIFEKYINNRADMGAYYTQEDVTGYIARNTIIPFLLNQAQKKCANAFDANSGIWRFLQEEPCRYIYDAVGQGCEIPNSEIPENIRCGLDEKAPNLLQRRKDWNQRTPEEFALPTEIWRETISRRQRYFDLKAKLKAGEIHDIDDLITYNLDIQLFAGDALDYEGSDFIEAFFTAIDGRDPLASNQKPQRGITILDPACGSGAFLFAALNVLEPLYEKCIDRMQEFVEDDDKRLQQRGGRKKYLRFRKTLKEVRCHPNKRYWIYKTIILKNLYGVDLMREAAEIAKLRLFLKLASEAEYRPDKDNLGLEPLPDIDFNIRSGNSLVGFSNLDAFRQFAEWDDGGQGKMDLSSGLVDEVQEQAQQVQNVANRFTESQDVGGAGYRQAKLDLSQQLEKLNEKLNDYLARQYGSSRNEDSYEEWLQTHQPFHWLAEFYGIMEEQGGFDVVIGNPPYIKMQKIKYLPKAMQKISCPNLYGHMVKRSLQFSKEDGRAGLIVMHNIAFGSEYKDVRETIMDGKAWFSFYSRIPQGLFTGADKARVRNSIFIHSRESNQETNPYHTTRIHRWRSKKREALFSLISYVPFSKTRVIPMLNAVQEEKIFEQPEQFPVGNIFIKSGKHKLYFKKTAYNYISVSPNSPPCFDSRGNQVSQAVLFSLAVSKKKYRDIFLLLFGGKLFFCYWLIYGDEFHFTKNNVRNFPLKISSISNSDMSQLLSLADKFAKSLQGVLSYKQNAGIKVGSYNTSKLWHITDQSDTIFLKYMIKEPDTVFQSIEDHAQSTFSTGSHDA